MGPAPDHRLTTAEVEQLERDGYVVRDHVFDADELADMVVACEQLMAELVKDRDGMRFKLGSYVFEPDVMLGVTIKWEGDSDVVHGIEPFAHISPELNRWALDRRFLDPMVDMVGDDDPILFTEKLNLKRPFHGGPNPLHQDYPYWIDVADDATRVATAILYLDDATLENGCLEVVPGSHASGRHPTRTDTDLFGNLEMDPDANAHMEPVPVEVEAGAVVLFGPFLAHKTGPNTSDRQRRALLFSYQPAGHQHALVRLRKIQSVGKA